MAHLVVPRAQDNSGNASSGATLTVYETGTTTPAELYSTAALAEAGGDGDLSNPVTADSAGRFVTVFVSETEVVDWQMHTSAGVLLQEVEGVKGVPGSPVAINLDFGDDGRFKVDGDGTIVQVEFGDPTGDNIGGDGRIGGWDGTQGGELEIDFDEVSLTGDMTTGGDVTVGGDLTFDGQTPDLVVLEGTETGVATKTLNLPTGYEFYEIDFYNIAPVSGGGFRVQLSYDNGASFKSTNEYDWNHSQISGGSISHDYADASAYIQISDDAANVNAGEAHHFRVSIVSTATKTTGLWWDGVIIATSQPRRLLGSAMTVGAYGQVTNLKIYTITGTMDFKYMVKARRRST